MNTCHSELRGQKCLALAALCYLLAPMASAQDMPLTQVLIDGEEWQLVSEGHQFTDGFTADADGNFYFADVKGGTTINKIAVDGTVSVFSDDAPRISGMQFGPDGRMYACQGGQSGRIVAFRFSGQRRCDCPGCEAKRFGGDPPRWHLFHRDAEETSHLHRTRSETGGC